VSERPVHYVQNRRQLADLIDELSAAESAAFDTEFIGERYYEPALCLLQLATPSSLWIVDPLTGLDLTPVWKCLTDEDREVLVFAAREEIRFCLRYAGRVSPRLLDLQIAAGMLGFGYPLSHTNTVRRLLDLQLAPGSTPVLVGRPAAPAGAPFVPSPPQQARPDCWSRFGAAS